MFIPNQRAFRRAFIMYMSGTRGGPVRLTILRMLCEREMNINNIATLLKMDYKTVQHHMRVLEKNSFVDGKSVKNEIHYSLSSLVVSNNGIMDEIAHGKM